MDAPRERVALALAACLQRIADDRDCVPDDLSVGVLRALETLALECYRLGDEDAHESPTLVTRLPSGISGVRESSRPTVRPVQRGR